jgi:hypothetical protein
MAKGFRLHTESSSLPKGQELEAQRIRTGGEQTTPFPQAPSRLFPSSGNLSCLSLGGRGPLGAQEEG